MFQFQDRAAYGRPLLRYAKRRFSEKSEWTRWVFERLGVVNEVLAVGTLSDIQREFRNLQIAAHPVSENSIQGTQELHTALFDAWLAVGNWFRVLEGAPPGIEAAGSIPGHSARKSRSIMSSYGEPNDPPPCCI